MAIRREIAEKTKALLRLGLSMVKGISELLVGAKRNPALEKAGHENKWPPLLSQRGPCNGLRYCRIQPNYLSVAVLTELGVTTPLVIYRFCQSCLLYSDLLHMHCHTRA